MSKQAGNVYGIPWRPIGGLGPREHDSTSGGGPHLKEAQLGTGFPLTSVVPNLISAGHSSKKRTRLMLRKLERS